jgi:hypothetical protein
MTQQATKHVHVFRKGRSVSVETCSCGKFRFTEEWLKGNAPVIELVETVEALDRIKGKE